MMPHERLRLARKAAGYKTAADFAKEADVEVPTYRSYENGHRGIPVPVAKRLAAKLQLPWETLVADADETTPPPTPRTRVTGLVTDNLVGERDLPIYASAQGGATGMRIILDDVVEWVKRPAPLFNVPGGFGMYVVGDSMEPAYRQGDMILVHPSKPPATGDDVLVVLGAEATPDHDAMIKQLVRADDRRVRLRQWNPREEFDVERDRVRGVYLVVGKYNRR